MSHHCAPFALSYCGFFNHFSFLSFYVQEHNYFRQVGFPSAANNLFQYPPPTIYSPLGSLSPRYYNSFFFLLSFRFIDPISCSSQLWSDGEVLTLPEGENLSKLLMSDLKAELAVRGLQTTGFRAALYERLRVRHT